MIFLSSKDTLHRQIIVLLFFFLMISLGHISLTQICFACSLIVQLIFRKASIHVSVSLTTFQDLTEFQGQKELKYPSPNKNLYFYQYSIMHSIYVTLNFWSYTCSKAFCWSRNSDIIARAYTIFFFPFSSHGNVCSLDIQLSFAFFSFCFFLEMSHVGIFLMGLTTFPLPSS